MAVSGFRPGASLALHAFPGGLSAQNGIRVVPLVVGVTRQAVGAGCITRNRPGSSRALDAAVHACRTGKIQGVGSGRTVGTRDTRVGPLADGTSDTGCDPGSTRVRTRRAGFAGVGAGARFGVVVRGAGAAVVGRAFRGELAGGAVGASGIAGNGIGSRRADVAGLRHGGAGSAQQIEGVVTAVAVGAGRRPGVGPLARRAIGASLVAGHALEGTGKAGLALEGADVQVLAGGAGPELVLEGAHVHVGGGTNSGVGDAGVVDAAIAVGVGVRHGIGYGDRTDMRVDNAVIARVDAG